MSSTFDGAVYSVVTEVPAGSRAVLECHSNDFDHNFKFWILGSNKVIGPGNDYDEQKYKYKVLSGKLHIDRVSPDESGLYKCVSQRLGDNGYTVGEVQMIVKDSFSAMDGFKLMAIVISIIVIISCVILYFRLRKQWNKYDGRGVIPVDDPEEEEGDSEEVYNRTTTPAQTPYSQPVAGPSRNHSSEHLHYGIDNQGLDTDFNSVFENIQIKTPPSLI